MELIPRLGKLQKNSWQRIHQYCLGDHFDDFINQQVKSGRYSSASEVVRAALRMFEREETKKDQLIKELIKGEKSGIVKNFDPDKFLESLHKKYVKK